MHEQHYYTMALSKVKNIGPVLGKSLIQHCGSAEAVFKEAPSKLLKIDGVGTLIKDSFRQSSVFERTDREVNFIEKNKIKLLTYTDPDYPEQLKHCFDAPLILFYKGTLKATPKRNISIVGTRKMTSYGRETLQTLIQDLKPYNPAIVSGLAFGVDVLAHRLALNNELTTVAVLAHGFDYMYPAAHAAISEKIIQNNGGLITEFWSGTPPIKENFVKRNRIVAGMAQAIIVIESAIRGGSLITADFANSYHRDVFAIPGRISDTFSAGCNQLIKTNQAAVLTSVKDLSYLLNWVVDKEQKTTSQQKELFIQLDATEQRIYDYLLNEGKCSLDLIALHCTYPIHKTTSALLNLELKALVRPLPGKYYEAI